MHRESWHIRIIHNIILTNEISSHIALSQSSIWNTFIGLGDIPFIFTLWYFMWHHNKWFMWNLHAWYYFCLIWILWKCAIYIDFFFNNILFYVSLVCMDGCNNSWHMKDMLQNNLCLPINSIIKQGLYSFQFIFGSKNCLFFFIVCIENKVLIHRVDFFL